LQPNPSRLLAWMAGSTLFVIPLSSLAAGNPKAVQLPPQFTQATQSASIVHPGEVSRLQVEATDPDGTPLGFSWSGDSGRLGPVDSSANASAVDWTAPACLAQGEPLVTATVTNGYGLSSSAVFDFDYKQDLLLDRQPPFTAASFDALEGLALTSGNALKAPGFQGPLSAESFRFSEDMSLSVTFLHKSAVGNSTLGYLYYDDLVARGYVDTRGTPGDTSDDTLMDTNGNGIADLHEDLYNLAPVSGPQARPYIGVQRRCARSFVSGQFVYSEPDLALEASCTNTFMPRQYLEDARPGRHPLFLTDVVGRAPTQTEPAVPAYSDNGLYPRIPNLLEPAHPANAMRGLGHLLFLVTDDDTDTTTYWQMGAVADGSSREDGIPDYDVSAYDAHGLPRSPNPDPGITPNDRTVDLGILPAGREVVFFLVTQFEARHDVLGWKVYPCLVRAADGACTLHLRTPTTVFFSKAKWNLDQDPQGLTPAAQRNIGCVHSDSCQADYPTAGSCLVAGTPQRLCGWLDSTAHSRLRQMNPTSPPVPMEAAAVPPSGNGMMPHVLLTRASTVPDQWLMGFEDISGGGDRDFNDVVFMLRGTPGGRARSTVLTQEDASCRLARVRFAKEDSPGTDCRAPQAPIAYEVATDCRLCDTQGCYPNPTPTWHRLSLPSGPASTIVDVSRTPGQQLCWRASVVPGASGACRPTITNVDVGYVSVPVNP
jgi:hypothetical protein